MTDRVFDKRNHEDDRQKRCPELRSADPGTPWLRDLDDAFAPIRQEAIDRGYTAEELDAAIDAAVAAVRSGKQG